MKMTVNDRLVLFAVQTAQLGLNEFGIVLMTNLGSEAIAESVGRLLADGAITGDNFTDSDRYFPNVVPDGSTSTSEVVWLRDFWSSYPPVIQGDTLGTTYLCCGAVILASVAHGTVVPEQVAGATSLPLHFVSCVLDLLEHQNVWSMDCVRDLRRILRGEEHSFADVQVFLRDALGECSEVCLTPEFERVLQEARSGSQVGGNRDEWVNEEGGC